MFISAFLSLGYPAGGLPSSFLSLKGPSPKFKKGDSENQNLLLVFMRYTAFTQFSFKFAKNAFSTVS